MSKFETLFNQILSEGKYTTNYGMSKFKSKTNPLSPYDDSLRDQQKREEQNAGVEETPISFKSSSYKYKIGDTYEKHGTKYIIARSPYTGKIGPQLVVFVKGENGNQVEYKVTGVDNKGYPISEPTGKSQKLREPTQWGTKDVPGGDID